MILSHLRHNVVAYLALLVAMTSTSYAAVQLANGSVTTPKLATNAVTSVKIKDRTITAADVASGVIPAAKPSSWFQAYTLFDTPAATYADSLLDDTATIPHAGPLAVDYFDPAIGASCNTSGASPFLGVYLDGTPVPKSRMQLNGLATPERDVVVLPVTAGHHTVTVGLYCDTGTVKSISTDSRPSISLSLS